jgi:homoserine/homoserine lactone efflux protein
MSVETYVTFMIAAFALAIVPGPTVTVIVGNSLRYGSKAGLMNVLGTQVGVVVWLTLAAFGLSAAIAVMGVWFDLLRYAGAAYFIWLGYKLLTSKGDMGAAKAVERDARGFFLQGFVVIMSNPKILVLFGAMIPPFLTPGGDAVRETLVLGATFMAIAAAGDTAYALLAGKAGSFLSRSRIRAIEVSSGLCLLVGGVWLAMRGR